MKITLITLSIILLSLKISAQTDVYTIDFQTKLLVEYTTDKSSKTAQIKINNFNPFLYKVTVSSKDSVIDESLDVPALWTYLSSIDNIQKLMDAIKKTSEPSNLVPKGTRHVSIP